MKPHRDKQIELALNETLFTHRLVFEALEIVNKEFERPVLLGEIIAVLNAEQTSALSESYKNPLINTVRQIVTALINRKLVFIARSERHRHYYAAISVFAPEKTPFVFRPSFRKTVINLIQEAIVHYNRPVRVGDIDKYLDKIRPDLKGDCKWFRPTVQRLVAERAVVIAQRIRQDKHGGHYYLLRDMDVNLTSVRVKS